MTDEKGIARGICKNLGPNIVWFKDPTGNILSVLKEGWQLSVDESDKARGTV
jgi:hypothetical protein